IEWWQQHNLPTRVIVDHTGRLTDMPGLGGPDWPSLDLEKAREAAAALLGVTVKQAKTKVVELLDAAGVLGEKREVSRMVPCAERSGAPLEIIVTPQWFVKVLDKKAALIEKGRQIKWHPEYMRVRYEIW
ncbi:class I tRNA ligase family protein, partial [bacterium]|nr:class I tRNA ligase family protein [bacterium]